jgi:hypothetical protein
MKQTAGSLHQCSVCQQGNGLGSFSSFGLGFLVWLVVCCFKWKASNEAILSRAIFFLGHNRYYLFLRLGQSNRSATYSLIPDKIGWSDWRRSVHQKIMTVQTIRCWSYD